MRKWFLLIMLLLFTGCSKIKYQTTINVLNWSSYIPDEVIRDFEEKYQIKVNYGTYSSNEELLAKVSSVHEGTYDLVFPSDYMVELMKSRRMLEKIVTSRLKNFSEIDSHYLGLDYDLYNQYSVPFLATCVVLAVNFSMIEGDIQGFMDLNHKDYLGSIVLLDDTRVVVGQALMALGYDFNSTREEELKEAQELLKGLQKNIKAFDSDSPKSFLISKEAGIGLMWSAEALLAKRENPSIQIIIPKEGYSISIDNFAILKGSKNQEAVYQFIDYILSSEVQERIVEDYPYTSVNVLTNEKLVMNNTYGEDYQKIKNLIRKGVRVFNIGEAITLYDRVWAYIK